MVRGRSGWTGRRGGAAAVSDGLGPDQERSGEKGKDPSWSHPDVITRDRSVTEQGHAVIFIQHMGARLGSS